MSLDCINIPINILVSLGETRKHPWCPLKLYAEDYASQASHTNSKHRWCFWLLSSDATKNSPDTQWPVIVSSPPWNCLQHSYHRRKQTGNPCSNHEPSLRCSPRYNSPCTCWIPPFYWHCAGESWASISTDTILAELRRRQEDGEKPACGSRSKGSYDTSAHVFALVLILVLSTLGKSPSIATTDTRLIWYSMRFPSIVTTNDARSKTKIYHFLLPAYWNRRPTGNGLCSPPPYRFRVNDRSMSPWFLQ